MCVFKKYQNIFGEPNTGVHSIRLFDFAIVDIIMTFIGAFFISIYINVNLWLLFIFIFLLGQIFHILFCVKTKFLTILQ
jgi:hypothetical protein